MKTNNISKKLVALAATIAIASPLTGVRAADISPAEAKAIAEEGFIYGLPLVMNYAIMNEYAINKDSGQFKAPFNGLFNSARVYTYKDTAILSANSDTPYSNAWLDLRAEPVVISVPAVPKERYYCVMLCDGNTYNYGYIGNRATGTEAGNYLVTGPDWTGEKPAGIDKVFQSSTPFGLTIFRTQLFDADDIPNVEKVQAGYKVQPLSAFLGQPAPPAAPKIDFVPANIAGIKENFYEYLDVALEFVPESELDKPIREKLAKIGVGPGKSFDFKDLSAEQKGAVLQGMKQGAENLAVGIRKVGTTINGWTVGSFAGSKEHFNGNWMLRAATAQAGIYGNDAIEAMYPLTHNDAEDQPMDGSKHNYTLTFPAGQYPPVNAFWSVTMYDGKTQLLIENPINRYLINSPMIPNMKKNEDGSLTLYIQNKSPGADKEANWLPAPDGPIYLVMRLYWPKTEDPSILPPGEGSWKPPGIMKAE